MDRICTIIALNYLPQVMALLESIRTIYPDIEVFVLITDAETRMQPHLPSANILLPDDLELSPAWLGEMKNYYDPVEFATSLKPFLLKTLLTEDVSTVTFLDPDILLFGDLTEGINGAQSTGISLVPHRITPVDPEGSISREVSFLRYGIFNLGYISVGQKGKKMLDWWGQRLRWYCTRFPDDVVFTDQKWANFVPALFDNEVLRHPGYDFASWNIDERPLSISNGKFLVAGEPLKFIHFSQMSGELAAGRGTTHWQDSLDFSEQSLNSLALISDITHNYSEKLILFRKIISEGRELPKPQTRSRVLSFHYRQRMIRESVYSARNNKKNSSFSHRVRLSPLSASKLALLLERSSTINGARKGFLEDKAKLTYRLRNLFQK